MWRKQWLSVLTDRRRPLSISKKNIKNNIRSLKHACESDKMLYYLARGCLT